jgi:hypothetical protein
MSDTQKMVQHYIAKLGDSNDDDAFHRLLELGPSVLPSIREGFRASSSRAVRHRLAEIVRHARSAEALPFLSDLLDDDEAEIWKTALDGLVSLGWEQANARPQVLDILRAKREVVQSEQREWIDEAMDQVSWPNKHV